MLKIVYSKKYIYIKECLRGTADRLWGPSYVKPSSRGNVWYIQRDKGWRFSKTDKGGESRLKSRHTISWVLMNTHFS